MKIALIGCGYLGKIHAKCIKEVKELELTGVFDISQEAADEAAKLFATVPYTNLQDLVNHCDVVDIVSATVTHFEVAKIAIASGKHCFIEKPITATTEEAEQLIALAKKHNVVIQVGHVERYNSAFAAALPHITQPFFFEAHRLCQFNLRGTDVSVVHDLMIHDIDLVLSIIKSKVIDIQATGHKYITEYLDMANVRLLFDNGSVASLNASRVAQHAIRKMHIFQPENNITVNFQEKKVEIIEFKNNTLIFNEIPIIEHNAIAEELSDFVQTILLHKTPKVTMMDGLNALRIADKVVQKILFKI